jgi:hypothetical protein
MRRILLASCVVLLAARELHAADPPVSTVSRPFQVRLVSLHRRQDRLLTRGPWVWVDESGRQTPIESTRGSGRPAAGPALYARFRITTEPRTVFRAESPPVVVEAVDDEGQSLVPPQDEPEPPSRAPARPLGAAATLELRLPLALPDQPGKTIKRLRGELPVLVAVRSAAPLAETSLRNAPRPALTAGDFTLAVRDVRLEPDRRATLTLSALLERPGDAPGRRANRAAIDPRVRDLLQHQLELVDDQSRPVEFQPAVATSRDAIRITLRVVPGERYSAPDRLRVYALTWTPIVVPFDFKDLPLP